MPTLCQLYANFYTDEVDEAFKIVEMKNPDNLKRTLGYVIGILARKQQQGAIPE